MVSVFLHLLALALCCLQKVVAVTKCAEPQYRVVIDPPAIVSNIPIITPRIVAVELVLCFREPNSESLDNSYCPLGMGIYTAGLDDQPHLLMLQERVDALPRAYPGAVGLLAEVKATRSDLQVITIGQALVPRMQVGVAGTLRVHEPVRTAQGPMYSIAIGVNCTSGFTGRNCTTNITQTTPSSSQATPATERLTTTVATERTATTDGRSSSPSTALSPASLGVGVAIGFAAAAAAAGVLALAVLIIGCCLFHRRRRRRRRERKGGSKGAENNNTDNIEMSRESPLWSKTNQLYSRHSSLL